MKKVLLSAILVTSLFSYSEEVIESVSLCKTPETTFVVTISSNSQDRALWIDTWDNLNNEELSYFLPIQNQKSFKTVKYISKWMTETFGETTCSPITIEEVQKEIEKQTKDYNKQFN